MNLRWVERNGERVLQLFRGVHWANQLPEGHEKLWDDVPVVQEPKKAREYLIEVFDNRLGPYRAWGSEEHMLKYQGSPPDPRMLIKVREVLPDSPEAK